LQRILRNWSREKHKDIEWLNARPDIANGAGELAVVEAVDNSKWYQEVGIRRYYSHLAILAFVPPFLERKVQG